MGGCVYECYIHSVLHGRLRARHEDCYLYMSPSVSRHITCPICLGFPASSIYPMLSFGRADQGALSKDWDSNSSIISSLDLTRRTSGRPVIATACREADFCCAVRALLDVMVGPGPAASCIGRWQSRQRTASLLPRLGVCPIPPASLHPTSRPDTPTHFPQRIFNGVFHP